MEKPVPDTLDAVLADIQSRWSGAVRNRHSPFHTPVVCSLDDRHPAPRIMVLRAASPDAQSFRFHTDARSPKVSQIGQSAPVSLLGYDAEARVQLTVRGVGRIEQLGPIANTAWQASALSSRRCYLAAHAPGTPVDAAMSGIPIDLQNRTPTEAETLPARENFAVLLVEADELEWLLLTSCGNKRARFTRADAAWAGQWITP